jgi:CRP/FNR family transcriptional regulator, cyclic AMP receptor protein
MDARAWAALAASHLGDLPPPLMNELLDGARRVEVSAGATIHREGEQVPHVEVVVHGLVRVHVTAPDGRTLTVRYCRVGALMGILSLYTTPFVMPATTQAVVNSDLLAIKPDVVRRLADHDVRVARALLAELSERASAFVAEIRNSTFSNVRQRIARHLLDLASEHQRGADLIAPISQQDLADAIGTVREVVVRTLRELRQEGLLKTGRGGIVITSPDRLFTEGYCRDG